MFLFVTWFIVIEDSLVVWCMNGSVPEVSSQVSREVRGGHFTPAEYCSAVDPMRIRDQETVPRATPTNFLNNPILLKFPHALWPELTKMKHRAPGSRATPAQLLLPCASP